MRCCTGRGALLTHAHGAHEKNVCFARGDDFPVICPQPDRDGDFWIARVELVMILINGAAACIDQVTKRIMLQFVMPPIIDTEAYGDEIFPALEDRYFRDTRLPVVAECDLGIEPLADKHRLKPDEENLANPGEADRFCPLDGHDADGELCLWRGVRIVCFCSAR